VEPKLTVVVLVLFVLLPLLLIEQHPQTSSTEQSSASSLPVLRELSQRWGAAAAAAAMAAAVLTTPTAAVAELVQVSCLGARLLELLLTSFRIQCTMVVPAAALRMHALQLLTHVGNSGCLLPPSALLSP
jgi:hypothetical protein